MPSRHTLQAFAPPGPIPSQPNASPPTSGPVSQPEVVAAAPDALTPLAPFPVSAASAPIATASVFPETGPSSNATVTSPDGDQGALAPVAMPLDPMDQPGATVEPNDPVTILVQQKPDQNWYEDPVSVIPIALAVVFFLLLAALVIGLFVRHQQKKRARLESMRAQSAAQHESHAHPAQGTQLAQQGHAPGVNLSSVAIAEEPGTQTGGDVQHQHAGTNKQRHWPPPPAPLGVQTLDGGTATESAQLNDTSASDAVAPAAPPPPTQCQASTSRPAVGSRDDRIEKWVQGGESSSQSIGAQRDAADAVGTQDLQHLSEALSEKSGSRNVLKGITNKFLNPSSTNDTRPPAVLCVWCKLAPKKRLCFALDFLHQEHRVFCQFYQLLSPTQRRFGASSVVYFAKDLRTEEEVALKFYTEEGPEASGVAATAYLLANEHTRAILYGPPVAIAAPPPLTVPPPAFIVNSPHSTPPVSPPRSPARHQQGASGSDVDGQSCDHIPGEPVLYAFPPCIVSPRGNSLSSWGQFLRKETNRREACMALVGVTRMVAQLHAAGYVHRGIKPTNVLRRIQDYKWVVSDYGCTAPTGKMAPVVCTSYYSPPESAQAHAAQQQLMPVHPSTDIWALGVLALEMLAHVRDPNSARPSSPGVDSKPPPHISSALGGPGPDLGSRGSFQNISGTVGRMPGLRGWSPDDVLPWEGDSELAEERRRKLGQLREVVLACVHRNSSMRPSVGIVLAAFEKERRDVVRDAAAGKSP